MKRNYYLNLRVAVLFIAVVFIGNLSAIAQEEDPNENEESATPATFSLGSLVLPNPNSIVAKYTYDPVLDRYIYTEELGAFNVTYPLILTPEEYEKRVRDEQMRQYFREKITAIDGRADEDDSRNSLVKSLYVKNDLFESIFGGDEITFTPQGSVEMDLGLLFTKQDNPAFSPRNRRNFTFDFDQRISLSLLGQVGERLQITANYDTESTFNFQNQIKLEYTPTEDDIIQKIEVGNVSMPLNSALIQGSQSLFGVKTELQFGKTRVTAVFSENQSQPKTVTAEGGATVQEFEVPALNYDENRHFFLAHYFRDTYNEALENYPFIDNRGVQVTRVEVWITNRQNQTTNARNIVAIQDIGESDPANIGVNAGANPGFINSSANAFPDNRNNDFNPRGINDASVQSQLTPAIRDVATVGQGFGSVTVQDGTDYVLLENARKLDNSQFTLYPGLGYISLNQRLNNDEVLGVAFQYTVGGQVYQVGEFANDGVNATEGSRPDADMDGIPDIADADSPVTRPDDDNDGIANDADADSNGDGILNGQDADGDGILDTVIPAGQAGSPVNLVVKMLKSNLTNVEEPIWDLMMKNIYPLGAFQLEQEGFRLNIVYADPSPINFISPVAGEPLPTLFDGVNNDNTMDEGQDRGALESNTLLRLFNLDRLTTFGDPQVGGDGFFDFVPGVTVHVQNGSIVFTTVEPFGENLFDLLSINDGAESYENSDTYNAHQDKYVYSSLYQSTKTIARDNAEKNKFLLKGRYKSAQEQGIPLGAFNIPQGSVTVTAGGRVLVEGLDYTVNYQLGRVIILDKSLEASGIPISASVENNTIFGQQNKRFTGINVEHQFSENFIVGGTFLNLNERPLTQKATYNFEPINNTIVGLNASYSTELPFLTRWVNKLPNIDTDVPSNLSVRGEVAYLLPGQPKGTDFNGEATSYIDDFEGSQTSIDIGGPLQWNLSSPPVGFGGEFANGDLATGYRRAKFAWYTIDPIFYNNQRPDGISDDDLSLPETRRVFRDEIFPQQDIISGQTQALFTLDLAYFPDQRGPYNFSPDAVDGTLSNPQENFGGITRQLTSTDFEQANVEFVEFWLLDPFYADGDTTSPGGNLTLNLGSISEDILKDGRKQYENGLPNDGGEVGTSETVWGKVPTNQSLVYAFDTEGQERTNQDIGYDGLSDAEEMIEFPNFANLPDPAGDNYNYFLNTEGGVVERYRDYNNNQGNSPVEVTQTNRGSTTFPDVEDVNRDNTMNTVDAYFEYELPINPASLSVENNPFVTDVRELTVTTQNGSQLPTRWVQFRVPINQATNVVGGINDFRAIRFMRMYMSGWQEDVVLRFGTLDLVRGDFRRYLLSLDPNENTEINDGDNTLFEVAAVNIEANETREPVPYALPPGVIRERLNNNNNNIRQNEQSLSLRVENLEEQDARGVYKYYSLDMRQYKNLKMFMHAEPIIENGLDNQNVVGFIRMGTDLNSNFYQIELPLAPTPFNVSNQDREAIWPAGNELDLPLELLQTIKSKVIAGDVESDPDDITYFDQNGDRILNPEEACYEEGQLRIGIQGLPSFGDVRTLMLGVKNGNPTSNQAMGCSPGEIGAEVWFNELRLSDLTNEGGYAGIVSLDGNIADFANVSATGRVSTVGFGSVEQNAGERSLEDVMQYDVVTNLNAGQLLPKKWGVQLPLNYSIGEQSITPKFDPLYEDVELDTSLDNAADQEQRDQIEDYAIDYTKRQSFNAIGVRKERTNTDRKPMPYDVENLTFSYSYSQTDHKDFEIEESLDQNVRLGGTYNFNFNSKPVEPFAKNDSLFTGKYYKFLKDFNFNYLPSSVAVQSNIVRQRNEQKFRDVFANDGDIALPRLFQRNYLFDWGYAIDFPITKSLRFNYNMNHNRVVRNYLDSDGTPSFLDDDGQEIAGFGIYDGFLDVGTPDTHFGVLQLNYDLPFDKFPFTEWITATYAYTANYRWQRGSQQFQVLENIPEIGNSVENTNTHAINGTLDMEKLYKYVGLNKKKKKRATASRPRGLPSPEDDRKTSDRQRKQAQDQDASSGSLSGSDKALNTGVSLLTAIKRVQVSYEEQNGLYLPGYLPTVGFTGSLKPTPGFIFGSQAEVRELAASNGWLTLFQDFNEQYREVESRNLGIQARIGLLKDLDIDLNMNRVYQENYQENYRVDPETLQYESLTGNSFGRFNISTLLIATAFNESTSDFSETFNTFRENRLAVADRLASEFYGGAGFERDENGFPEGFGRTNQRVLLPAFLSAYSGRDVNKTDSGFLRNVPLPNWNIKYTGLMNLDWFRDKFKRFSVQHGYTAGYSVNNFQTNLAYDRSTDRDPETAQRDQAGNFLNETLLGNVTLTEQFTPLVRIDFEMKNSVKILAEVKRDRALGLSFDNNLLTEIKGNEYILGLGYRIKDLRFVTNFGGSRRVLKSDLNFKADLSLRQNETIIRYLDIDNSQTTQGQDIYGLRFTADYALTKNLTALFYYDHTFSTFAISTAFPQTTIRSGFTLRYNFGN
ncbi:cell surface protein SprA [uncultured Dokdonia sp.]|uniref:T9SS outer membrane translocon Sov/SprA n=1 Tax=uncultured Dokdonia sp. TaxID=575653 RepID=UPI0026152790|nr:cell surface protein SprA [uncultured Dokdonia sp.]